MAITALDHHSPLSVPCTLTVQTEFIAKNILRQIFCPKTAELAIIMQKKEEVIHILAATGRSRVFTCPGQRACNVALHNPDPNPPAFCSSWMPEFVPTGCVISLSTIFPNFVSCTYPNNVSFRVYIA